MSDSNDSSVDDYIKEDRPLEIRFVFIFISGTYLPNYYFYNVYIY
jgi:hypothetical protein